MRLVLVVLVWLFIILLGFDLNHQLGNFERLELGLDPDFPGEIDLQTNQTHGLEDELFRLVVLIVPTEGQSVFSF